MNFEKLKSLFYKNDNWSQKEVHRTFISRNNKQRLRYLLDVKRAVNNGFSKKNITDKDRAFVVFMQNLQETEISLKEDRIEKIPLSELEDIELIIEIFRTLKMKGHLITSDRIIANWIFCTFYSNYSENTIFDKVRGNKKIKSKYEIDFKTKYGYS